SVYSASNADSVSPSEHMPVERSTGFRFLAIYRKNGILEASVEAILKHATPRRSNISALSSSYGVLRYRILFDSQCLFNSACCSALSSRRLSIAVWLSDGPVVTT